MYPKTLITLSFVAVLCLAVPRTLGAEGSDASDKIRVVVEVDMTAAGRKIVRPTPEKPTYYLPISVGYKNFGVAHHFQRPPPNSWDVAHVVAKALFNQGYVLMTKEGHPSQVLYFWWGYMAPQDVDVASDEANVAKPGAIGSSSQWGAGQGRPQGGENYNLTSLVPGKDGANPYPNPLPSFGLGMQNLDERQMLSLVAGDTVDDHQKYPDPRLDDVVQMTTAPRYYVLISAFDFQS